MRKRGHLLNATIAFTLAVLTLPVVALLALISAVTFRAWPFFTQVRLGWGGRPFRFVKIRSLPADTPADADKYAIDHVAKPRVAELMRRHHLDELPQLWLVVSGRMALVGPRPEMPSLTGRYDDAFVADRTSVRPGCTGLWQVSQAAAGLIGEAPEYDRWYVDHRSLALDAWILWRTCQVILGGRRTATLADLPTWAGGSPVDRSAQTVIDLTLTPGGPVPPGVTDDRGPDAPPVAPSIDRPPLNSFEPADTAA